MPNFPYRLREGSLADDDVGPKEIQQLRARHHSLTVADQVLQQPDGLRGNRNTPAALAKLEGLEDELEVAEAIHQPCLRASTRPNGARAAPRPWSVVVHV